MKNFLLFFGLSVFSITINAQTTIGSSYSFNQFDVYGFTWPITIIGGSESSPVVISLNQNINLDNTSQYFIIESEYVEFNGNNYTVVLDNISGYPGLLQNGTSSLAGYDNVTVQNVNVVSNSS